MEPIIWTAWKENLSRRRLLPDRTYTQTAEAPLSSTAVSNAESQVHSYPRVLIISPSILNPMDGGGVLMANLFKGWPRECLADIYSQNRFPPNYEICANYYRLYPRISADPFDWIKRTRDYLLGRSESLDGITSFRLTHTLKEWVQQFQPDIVYSHLGPLWLTRLTNYVCERLGIPLVIHINDDYITDWPVMGHRNRRIFPVAQVLHALNYRAFRASLARAKKRIVVSEAMKTEYERRYGYEFDVFTNGVDPALWPAREIPERLPNRPFRVLYAGSISTNTNFASIRDVAETVDALAAKGLKITLSITRPAVQSLGALLERFTNVLLIDIIPHGGMPERLSDADLLLLPFNFDDESIRFFRYSWPTKMPEFMISGRPILLYGPTTTAFGQYAEREAWAYVVGKRDRRELELGILGLMENLAFRQTLARKAREIVLRDHDITKRRLQFQSALRRLT